jgi:hypothetical protein
VRETTLKKLGATASGTATLSQVGSPAPTV